MVIGSLIAIRLAGCPEALRMSHHTLRIPFRAFPYSMSSRCAPAAHTLRGASRILIVQRYYIFKPIPNLIGINCIF